MECGGSAHTTPSTPDRPPTEPSRWGAPEAERKHEDTSASPQGVARPPPAGTSGRRQSTQIHPPQQPHPAPNQTLGPEEGKEGGGWSVEAVLTPPQALQTGRRWNLPLGSSRSGAEARGHKCQPATQGVARPPPAGTSGRRQSTQIHPPQQPRPTPNQTLGPEEEKEGGGWSVEAVLTPPQALQTGRRRSPPAGKLPKRSGSTRTQVPARKASPVPPPLGRADDVSQPRSIPPNNPTPRPTRPWGLRRRRRVEDGVWRQCSHRPQHSRQDADGALPPGSSRSGAETRGHKCQPATQGVARPPPAGTSGRRQSAQIHPPQQSHPTPNQTLGTEAGEEGGGWSVEAVLTPPLALQAGPSKGGPVASLSSESARDEAEE